MMKFAAHIAALSYTNMLLAKASVEHRLLHSAIEQSGEAIIITDAAANIQYVNPAFASITGYEPRAVLGQNPRLLHSGRQDAAFYRQMWQTLTGGPTWQGRRVNRRQDVELYTEDATISPVRDQDGTIVSYVAVKRDVTAHLRIESEKQQIEAQYQQAQKVESVGRLAGGIAHDLNNLLLPIIFCGEMLQDDIAPHDERRRSVDDILASAFRARDLVSQLLAFSRRQPMAFQVLDLNAVVRGLERLLRRTICENVRIDMQPADQPLHIMADAGQVEQGLVNLAVNAQDAMPDGGRLTIETGSVELDAAYAQRHTGVTPGAYAMLSVSDSGHGIAAEVRQHIFEPFYSTKGDAGTGMGLATVYGIVKQHKGNIWVYSEPARGTVFKVYLPLQVEPCAAAGRDRQPSALPANLAGDETVLLVEDNASVRDLCQRVLVAQGYTVLPAAGGAEALALLERISPRIDLVLTDVIMPGMNGRELYLAVRQRNLGVQVVYMSGYTGDVITRQRVLEDDATLLQKPFTTLKLLETVRGALSS